MSIENELLQRGKARFKLYRNERLCGLIRDESSAKPARRKAIIRRDNRLAEDLLEGVLSL